MSSHNANKNLDSNEVYEVFKKCGNNMAAAARELGVADSTVRMHIRKFEDKNGYVKDNVNTLKARLKDVEIELREEKALRDKLFKLVGREPKAPDWILKPKGKVKQLTGIPTLFCSDWHLAEVVNSAEIGGVNQYNMTVARQRVRNLVAVAIELLTKHIAGAEYTGIVLALGGDMLSGDIHEELSETNEMEINPALLEALDILVWVVDQLKAVFKNVFIVGVTGNHGRQSRKPRAKRRNHTNFDWLLYHLLANHYCKNPAVTFLIPEGPDASYRIYNHRYLLTHGDQFRGGDGMIGMLGPVTRGDHKKRTRQMQVGQSYDTMLMGHWHQFTPLMRTIVNGSLKGYDEYAFANNFPYEPPIQGLWITHPQLGITWIMPIYVDRPAEQQAAAWVSVPREAKS